MRTWEYEDMGVGRCLHGQIKKAGANMGIYVMIL